MKTELLKSLSKIMANNWIETGDQQESKRSTCELQIRRIYKNSTIAELNAILSSITVRQVITNQARGSSRARTGG